MYNKTTELHTTMINFMLWEYLKKKKKKKKKSTCNTYQAQACLFLV